MKPLLLVVVMMACVALAGTVQGATTAPTTQASDTQRLAEVRQWFAGLADDDPQVREASRVALMGLSRQELGLLRQVVAESRPLRPSQAAVLRDIVTHVYLSGEDMKGMQLPFVGIQMSAVLLDGQANSALRQEGGLEGASERSAVVVTSRIAGFIGYRMFLDGDVVLGIAEPNPQNVQTPDALGLAIGSYRPGDRVTFLVLRHGHLVRLTMTLDERPLGLGQVQSIEQFQLMRQEKADAFWERDFAALLGEKVS